MEKSLKKFLSVAVIAAIAVLGTGCNNNKQSVVSTKSTSTSTSVSTSTSTADNTTWYVTYKGKDYTKDDSFTVYINETVAILAPHYVEDSTGTFTYASSDPSVVTISDKGLLAPIKTGTANVTVTESVGNTKIVFAVTVSNPDLATGGASYAKGTYEERTQILGTLEKYAVDNYLTGLTMFSNGGYVAYNSRYTPKPKEYVTGYGWGTLREGTLDGELPHPITGLDSTYYTIGTTSLPAHANAMDASGSDVSDLAGNIQNSFFSTRLNEESNGYEWYPSLAIDSEKRPVPITVADNGTETVSTDSVPYGTTWRIHVKTGDVKYRTGASASSSDSKIQAAAAYDGTSVKLEDYLTPLKIMLTNYNGMYRGAELTTGTAGFANSAAYYNGTTTNPNNGNLWDETLWEKTAGKSIKTGTDSTGDYIQFELLYPCTQFYAMYYLSSQLYSPLPADFIKIWGAKNFGKFMTGYTPAETTLSTGPYYIEKYTANDALVLKKNASYFHQSDTLASGKTRSVYNIPGVNYKWTGVNTNVKNWFESGSVDSYAPNKDDIAASGDFNTDTGTTSSGISWKRFKTKGDANFKLNVNACTEDEWKYRFGTSGKIFSHASNKYWDVKPYMSNIHFLNFLSFSLDRQSICEARGMTPTQEYLSDNYLIDPESGVSYNSTDTHKAVLADRYNETYGYNPTYAKSELDKVMDDVIVPMGAAGKLNATSSGAGAGTSNNPWKVPIHMAWMNTTDSEDYSDVFDGIKKAFNEEIAETYGGGYTLDIVLDSVSSDYQQVYTNMEHGDFDLGFGAISGNDLDPLSFLEVLKSNNSSSFTLNWGPDTSEVSDNIVYDGKKWSYDSLWQAGTSAVALANDGSIAGVRNTSSKIAITGSSDFYESKNATDQSVTYQISFKSLIEAGASQDMSISIYAGTASNAMENINTLALIGATAANNYVTTVTLPKKLNSYDVTTTTTDSSGNTTSTTTTNNCNVATMKVYYYITINGVKSQMTSTISLPTYYGITNA